MTLAQLEAFVIVARLGSALAGHDWLARPSGADQASDTGRLLARLGVPESRLRVFSSEAAAWGRRRRGMAVTLWS